MPFKLVLRLTIERKEFTLTYMAGFCVVGPLGGLLGHGVASTIGGVALDGLEAEVSESHPASCSFLYFPAIDASNSGEEEEVELDKDFIYIVGILILIELKKYRDK